MDYKSSIDRFRGILDRYSHEGKPLMRASNAEVMAEISLVQQEWGNRFRLNEAAGILDLAAGESFYTVGSNSYNIPSDLYTINKIEISRESCPYGLSSVSKDQMNAIEKSAGLPRMYTIYGTNDERVFELDTIPENSYDITSYPEARLNYVYTRKFDYFTGAGGVFSDYDESEADYGGEWKLPSEYQGFMVEYAAAKYSGDTNMMLFYEQQAKQLFDSRPMYAGTRLNYSMGGV